MWIPRHAQAGERTILEEARKIAPSIRADGRARVLEGVTSVEEVLRVTREE